MGIPGGVKLFQTRIRPDADGPSNRVLEQARRLTAFIDGVLFNPRKRLFDRASTIRKEHEGGEGMFEQH